MCVSDVWEEACGEGELDRERGAEETVCVV